MNQSDEALAVVVTIGAVIAGIAWDTPWLWGPALVVLVLEILALIPACDIPQTHNSHHDSVEETLRRIERAQYSD
jgi:hypothetical protein